MRNEVIILAAGKGKRMMAGFSKNSLKSKKNKLLLLANEKPLIYYSLMAFNDHPEISGITLVVNSETEKEMKKILDEYRFSKVRKVLLGGDSRQESLEIAFADLEENLENREILNNSTLKNLNSRSSKTDILVIVHNGANPFPSAEDISGSIQKAKKHGACIVGHFLKSTIKEINGEHIVKTHDRTKLFAAETPQVIKMSLLGKAIKHAKKIGLKVTDEAMLVEELGEKIYYLEADKNNFKVTLPSDLEKVRQIVGEPDEDFRVGIGQDSHEFVVPWNEEKSGENKCPPESLGLNLGGIFLPKARKMKANSDGDVILHAAFNAISQAIGEKSLGFYADPLCEKGITDSREYLKVILAKMASAGYKLNTLGIMLECKRPKIDPIVNDLKKSLSVIFNLPTDRIGITATSGENLTAFGQGIGIQCFVIVSLVRK